MKYKISAEAVGYLQDIIEANSEKEAEKIMEEMLVNGAMPEVGFGSIENKQVELLQK